MIQRGLSTEKSPKIVINLSLIVSLKALPPILFQTAANAVGFPAPVHDGKGRQSGRTGGTGNRTRVLPFRELTGYHLCLQGHGGSGVVRCVPKLVAVAPMLELVFSCISACPTTW